MQVLDPIRPTTSAANNSFSRRVKPSDAVTAKEAREELARVIASDDFPATGRNRRFLSFVVEQALQRSAGTKRVTAKEVAVQVFGRAESFQSAADAIVRIEASKLRRDLELYYLKSGKRNPVRIEIPRGGYDPAFFRRNGGEQRVGASAPASTGNHAEDVSAELHRVLDSSDFTATARNRRFLAYVVEKELAGATGEISAAHVATRAFGRDPGFDPRQDPIVRIEAARLRRDLETYYLKAGSVNPLRITIPKGRYRPVFVANS